MRALLDVWNRLVAFTNRFLGSSSESQGYVDSWADTLEEVEAYLYPALGGFG